MNNKRGFISLFTIFVLMMVIMVLALAQNKVDSSTIDKTIQTLNWSVIGSNITISMQRAIDGSPNEIVKIVLNVANKAVDFFGYTIFELTKLAMTLARDNPDIINYKVLLALILLSLIVPLLYPIFIITVSLIIIVREWVVSRKEKRELKKLKEKK